MIQCGPPRSGTTLIYNILRELSSTGVKKQHFLKPEDYKKKIYISYRNPFDSIVSLMQCYQRKINDKTIIYSIDEFLNNGGELIIRNFDSFCKRKNVIIFKYENFVNNLNYIFENIGMEVCPKKRKEIINKFNINKVKNMTKKYKTFYKYDPVTHWHGRHISVDNGQPTKYKKYLNEKQIKMINNRLCNKLGECYINFTKLNNY